MRKHLIWLLPLLALLVVLGASGNANAYPIVVWQNYPPTALQDQNGVNLPLGTGLIQLIWDAGKDGIDDPMTYFGGAAPGWWIADGCPPVDDDVLAGTSPPVNPTSINVMDGYFYEASFVLINPGLEGGEYLYTRFFTSATPGYGDWYGEAGELWEAPVADECHTYMIYTGAPIKADTHIVPEPSIFLLLGGGLILLLLKRRK